jgi:dihydroorotase
MYISVRSPADFHVHLRQGSISELVTTHVRKGGFDLAYVMVSITGILLKTEINSDSYSKPNLKPPIASTEQALKYKADLQRIDPDVQYLMTLYLSPELTPDEIRKAKEAGIVGTFSSLSGTEDVLNHLIGVKSYPRGVTTNSEGGIESYEAYYPVFEAMQEVDMVLNLHGEVHSDAAAVGFSLTSKS